MHMCLIKRGKIWPTDKMLKWIWWFLGSNLCWVKDWRCRLETRLDNRGKKWQWWHHWPQNLDHHRNNLHLHLSLLWFCNFNFSEEKIQSETEKWHTIQYICGCRSFLWRLTIWHFWKMWQLWQYDKRWYQGLECERLCSLMMLGKAICASAFSYKKSKTLCHSPQNQSKKLELYLCRIKVKSWRGYFLTHTTRPSDCNKFQ